MKSADRLSLRVAGWCRQLLLVLACGLMAGCAAQRAYEEGREFAGKGMSAEALAKFEEAQRLDGGSSQYRIAALQAREQLVRRELQAAAGGKPADARAAYQRVLQLEPHNQRAQEGLRRLEAGERRAAWLAKAEAALAKSDDRGAQTWARMVLAEEPSHTRARQILQDTDAKLRPVVAPSALSEAYRKPISIEFREAPLRSIFEVISRTSGLNFVFDKDVRTDQKASILLKNSTIEAAVNLTLLTNQLEMRVLDGNSVLVYPKTAAKQKEYRSLSVRTFYLANADAKTVAATLKTVLKAGDVVADDKLNMLILRDTPETIRLAERLVALHDVAEPEVMLEVEILEVKRNRLLNLGVQWPDLATLTPLAVGGGTSLKLSDLINLGRDQVGVTVTGATVNAKKADTDANLLANPRIRTKSREKAKILIGERVPNITTTSTATGFVAESVNYVDVGLKLDVEPVVGPEGEVVIKIALEVSNIVSQLQTKSGSVAYQIGTRGAQTTLRLKDGENQVLAGLINDEDRRTANKVPALGEVPVVGRLFGSQLDDSMKTEIVLSITPRVLRNIQQPDASFMEFDSGPEASTGSSLGGGSGGAVVSSSGGGATPVSSATAPADNRNRAAAQTAGTALSGGTAAASSITNSGGSGTSTTGSITAALQGPSSLKAGDNFTVQLIMQAGTPVSAVPMVLGFDPKVVQALSVTEGDLLRRGDALTSFSARIDASGQIIVSAGRAGDTGASGSGVLCTMQFKVIGGADQQTRLQVMSLAPAGVGGGTLAVTLPPPLTVSIGR